MPFLFDFTATNLITYHDAFWVVSQINFQPYSQTATVVFVIFPTADDQEAGGQVGFQNIEVTDPEEFATYFGSAFSPDDTAIISDVEQLFIDRINSHSPILLVILRVYQQAFSIKSEEAFAGLADVALDRNKLEIHCSSTSITTSEAFGTPRLQNNYGVTAIASAEAFGTPALM